MSEMRTAASAFSELPVPCTTATLSSNQRFVFDHCGGRTMSELQRRDVLIGTAGLAVATSLAAMKPAQAGDPSFMNNVPDPLLSDDQLPTFKFALEKSE